MKKDVLIGFPAYDGRSEVHTVIALQNAVHDPNSPIMGIQQYAGDSLVTRARNRIVWHFMNNKQAKFLFFLDTDIYIKPEQIAQIRAHNKPLCCGIYLKKKLPYSPVLNGFIKHEGNLDVWSEAGTGLMMIRKDLIAGLEAMGLSQSYKGEASEPEGIVYDHFEVGVRDNRYLSEDYLFCHKVRELGHKVYVDPTIIGTHRGIADYPFQDEKIIDTATQLLELRDKNKPYEEAYLRLIEQVDKNREKINTQFS